MNNVVDRVAHKTLRLADLAPDRAASFSPNLHEYMKEHGHFFRDGGTLVGVYSVRPSTRAAESYGEGTLMLGIHDGDFVTGTRVISALCNGASAERSAHPIGKSVIPVDGFWSEYLNIGRCAIDPAHTVHFHDDRFSMNGDTRTCQWCGAKHERVLTPRTVYDVSWIASAHE